MTGVVELRVPATTSSVRFVRLIAAAVADEADFDMDEVDDLRIAVDELAFALIGAGAEDAQLTITIQRQGAGVTVRGECAHPIARPGPSTDAAEGLMNRILATVVDEHALERGENGGFFELRKARRS